MPPFDTPVNVLCDAKATRKHLSVTAAPLAKIDTYGLDDGSGRQRWSLEECDGMCYVKTCDPARPDAVLTVTNQGVTLLPRAPPQTLGISQLWRAVDRGDGAVSFEMPNGCGMLSAHADQWNDDVDVWSQFGPEGRQAWRVVSVAGPQAPAPAPAPAQAQAQAPAVTGKTQVPPGAALRLNQMLGLTEEQVDTIQSLVACPENSTTRWERAYAFAKFLGDGRGITFTIFGACSGTGDGVLVLRQCARRDPRHPLAAYVDAMARARGDSRAGLAGFEDAIHRLGNDATYREATWAVYVDMYWTFARDFCYKLGGCAGRPGPVMRSALAIGAITDTALNHGGDMGSFKPILGRMRNPAEPDEGRWLKNFMDARHALLKSGYQDLDTSGTGARAFIWIQLVNERNWDLRRPIKVYAGKGAYWGRQTVA